VGWHGPRQAAAPWLHLSRMLPLLSFQPYGLKMVCCPRRLFVFSRCSAANSTENRGSPSGCCFPAQPNRPITRQERVLEGVLPWHGPCDTPAAAARQRWGGERCCGASATARKARAEALLPQSAVCSARQVKGGRHRWMPAARRRLRQKIWHPAHPPATAGSEYFCSVPMIGRGPWNRIARGCGTQSLAGLAVRRASRRKRVAPCAVAAQERALNGVGACVRGE